MRHNLAQLHVDTNMIIIKFLAHTFERWCIGIVVSKMLNGLISHWCANSCLIQHLLVYFKTMNSYTHFINLLGIKLPRYTTCSCMWSLGLMRYKTHDLEADIEARDPYPSWGAYTQVGFVKKQKIEGIQMKWLSWNNYPSFGKSPCHWCNCCSIHWWNEHSKFVKLTKPQVPTVRCVLQHVEEVLVRRVLRCWTIVPSNLG